MKYDTYNVDAYLLDREETYLAGDSIETFESRDEVLRCVAELADEYQRLSLELEISTLASTPPPEECAPRQCMPFSMGGDLDNSAPDLKEQVIVPDVWTFTGTFDNTDFSGLERALARALAGGTQSRTDPSDRAHAKSAKARKAARLARKLTKRAS